VRAPGPSIVESWRSCSATPSRRSGPTTDLHVAQWEESHCVRAGGVLCGRGRWSDHVTSRHPDSGIGDTAPGRFVLDWTVYPLEAMARVTAPGYISKFSCVPGNREWRPILPIVLACAWPPDTPPKRGGYRLTFPELGHIFPDWDLIRLNRATLHQDRASTVSIRLTTHPGIWHSGAR